MIHNHAILKSEGTTQGGISEHLRDWKQMSINYFICIHLSSENDSILKEEFSKENEHILLER